MSKLTDSQLIILSKAAQREDGAAMLPQGMSKAAAFKLASGLVGRKLMREIKAKPGMPVWRVDEEGRGFGLVILKAGRDAISIAEDGNDGSDAPAIPLVTPNKRSRRGRISKVADILAAPEVGTRPDGCRAGSKQALLVNMLSRADGATIEELMAATQWLAHTVRAALTGLRKRGYELDRQRSDSVTRYRITQRPDVWKAA